MAQKRTAYKWEYLQNHYDRISLTVKQGMRDTIRKTAEAKGQSLNAYINDAIREALERDGVKMDEGAEDEGNEE